MCLYNLFGLLLNVCSFNAYYHKTKWCRGGIKLKYDIYKFSYISEITIKNKIKWYGEYTISYEK